MLRRVALAEVYTTDHSRTGTRRTTCFRSSRDRAVRVDLVVFARS